MQAGQVAPKDLYNLARQVGDFSCADASCASIEDQVMIDEAVEEMGGYAALDADLRGAFAEAIEAAHHFTSCALSISPSIASMSRQTSGNRVETEASTGVLHRGPPQGSLGNPRKPWMFWYFPGFVRYFLDF